MFRIGGWVAGEARVISEPAHQDIERNAVRWARNHSLTQAIDWQDVVYRQLETIPEMPESYSLAPENPKSFEIGKSRGVSGEGYSPRDIIGRNEELKSLTILEFCETSNEI